MRRAFSLVELVFVVAVVSILASVFAAKFTPNPLVLAANQIASHIRYAQFLALSDDSFDPALNEWHTTWQIVEFSNINTAKRIKNVCENQNCWRYNLYRDKTGSTNLNSLRQATPDPLAPQKRLTAGFSPGSMTQEAINALNLKLNLTYTYGVKRVRFSGGCVARSEGVGLKLRFDELGRVYLENSKKPYDNAITSTCEISLFDAKGRCWAVRVAAQTSFVRSGECAQGA